MPGARDHLAVEGRPPAEAMGSRRDEPPLPATSSFLALEGGFAAAMGGGADSSRRSSSTSSSGGEASFASYDLLAPEEELRNESSMSDIGPALPLDFDSAADAPASPSHARSDLQDGSGGSAFPRPPKEALHNLRAYGAEHFQRMREAELLIYTPDPTYEHRQKELRPDMRAQLVDWMMEVTASLLARRRTLQMAVNYCDRYLSACPHAFPRDRLQLLAVTSLFVAAKMEEIYPPKAQEMAATTGGGSSAREIVAFEQELMTTLGWNLAPPTVDDWAESYLLALLDHLPTQAELPKGLLRRLQLILDLALLDVTALHFFPSTLAAAALGLLLPPDWAPALTACTGYPQHEPAFRHCQAYLTFLAAGLLDEDASTEAAADGLYDTPPTTPSTALDDNTEQQGGREAAESEVPAWDRPALQRHPPRLLPHLLARITGLASESSGAVNTSSCSSHGSASVLASLPPASAAAAASPMSVAATPMAVAPPPILGCRPVGVGRQAPVAAAITVASASSSSSSSSSCSGNEGDGEWEEDGDGNMMDDSASFCLLGAEEAGTDYGSGASDGEAEDEEDHPLSRRYLRGASALSPPTTAAPAIAGSALEASGASCSSSGLVIDVLRREELGFSMGSCSQADTDELQWSAATTTDAACSRDSLFAFFALDDKQGQEWDEGAAASRVVIGVEGEAAAGVDMDVFRLHQHHKEVDGYRGDGESLGYEGNRDKDGRRRRRSRQRQPHQQPWHLTTSKRFASPEEVGAGRADAAVLASFPSSSSRSSCTTA